MKQKIAHKLQGIGKKQLIAITTALAVVLILIVLRFASPQRSVATYCKVYRQESAILATTRGDMYSAEVFRHHSDNPKDFLVAFSNLDAVAPNSIEPDVRTLQNLFQTINKDPTKGFNASLGAVGADLSVKNWTVSNCGE